METTAATANAGSRIQTREVQKLDASLLAEAEALVARCSAAAGFDLELHDDGDLNLDQTMPRWILATAGESLAAVASLFAPRSEEVEVTIHAEPGSERMALYAAVADCAETMARGRGIPSILYCVDARLPEAATAATLRGAVQEFSELALARKLDAAQDGEYGRAAIAAFPGLELCRVGFSDVEGIVAASMAIFEDEAAAARNLILASLRSSTKAEPISPPEDDPSGTGDATKDYGEARYLHALALDGKYIGMGTLSYPRGDEARIRESVMINGLGILPELRGQGLGRAMLRGLIGIAASPGTTEVPQAREIRLEVDTGNPPALNLYLSEGFCETARTDYFRLKM